MGSIKLEDGSQLGIGFDDTDIYGVFEPIDYESATVQEIQDARPKLPIIEHNGVRFVALPDRQRIGIFHIYPVKTTSLFVSSEGNYQTYAGRRDPKYKLSESEAEQQMLFPDVLEEDCTEVSLNECFIREKLIFDSSRLEDNIFVIKLMIQTVEEVFGRYSDNDYFAYIDQLSREELSKIERDRRLKIFMHYMSSRSDFTGPLKVALKANDVGHFKKVLVSKINHYGESQVEALNKGPIRYVPHLGDMGITIEAHWFHELALAMLSGTRHMRDYATPATYKGTMDAILKVRSSLTDNQLTTWTKRVVELSPDSQTDNQPTPLQSEPTKTVLVETVKAHLEMDFEQLASWRLTPQQIRQVLTQQGSTHIFDVLKYLIHRYTSDPKIYLSSKKLTVAGGYKGFTSLLETHYGLTFKETRVTDALLWWDSLKVQHKCQSPRLPPMRFLALDSSQRKAEMYITYMQGITDPISDRLVPILNHPLGQNRSRLLYSKLGLSLSSLIVEESDIYLSNGGERGNGIPFRKQEMDMLKKLTGASRSRYIHAALEVFEEDGAIQLQDGFLKLGTSNKAAEVVILEGAQRSISARQRRNRQIAKKSGSSK